MGRVTFAVLGVLLIALGIVAALYTGVWVCLVGGIVDVIEQFTTAAAVDPMAVAVGIVKVLFAGPAGWLTWCVFVVPGVLMIRAADVHKPYQRRRRGFT